MAEFMAQQDSAGSDACYIANAANLDTAATAASLAGAQRAPLLLVDEDGMLSQNALEVAAGYKNVFVAGTYADIDSSVEQTLAACATCKRLRTPAELVAQGLDCGLGANGALVANKAKLSAQLAAGVFAASKNTPLVSASKTDTRAVAALKQSAAPAYSLTVLGDESTFPQSLRNAVTEAMEW